MSEEPIAPSTAEADIERTDSFSDTTESDNMLNSEGEDSLQTNVTYEEGIGSSADVDVDGDDDEDGNGDGDNELALSNTLDIPEYQDKLKVIHDRITRIVNRISYLTNSLKQVHQGLKNYTNEKAEENSPTNTDQKKAVGDIGSTQTDPLIKPELNMLAERMGDSVACQTIEDDPFAD